MAKPTVAIIDAQIEAADILEQMRGAQAAPEPGAEAFTVKDVIQRGDGDIPASMVHDALTSAGYSFIYHRKTGHRSLCNNNMLPAKLKERDADEPVFTLRDPQIPQRTGSYKCFLHPDDPSHEEYERMGFPVCAKANLINEYERRRHMESKHSKQWAAIKEDRERAEREEDRALQRQVLAALAGQPGKEPAKN